MAQYKNQFGETLNISDAEAQKYGYTPQVAQNSGTQAITSEQLQPASSINLPTIPTIDNSGAMVAGATATSDYIKNLYPETEGSKLNQTFLNDIVSLTSDYGQKGADQLKAEQDAGIGTMKQEYADLSGQIATKTAEYNALQTAEDKLVTSKEGQGRGLTLSDISGQQGAIRRQFLAEKNAKASEIGLIQAQAQAKQGQISQAQATVDRSIDLKYSTIENQLKVKQAQLEALKPYLDKEEKILAERRQVILDREAQDLADKKAAEKQKTDAVLNLMSDYPDAKIQITDTIPQAQAKLANSKIYQQKTRLVGGSDTSPTSVAPISSQPVGSIIDNQNGTYTYVNNDGTTHTGLFGDNYVDNTIAKNQPLTPTITGKPRNDTQNLALGYATRTQEADKIINEIGSKFTGVFDYVSNSGFFPNILKSADRQKFEQAERNFVNAVLRKESGAAISPSEFANAAKQYFPQPGDSEEVLSQKAANRQTVINNLFQSSNTLPPSSQSSSYAEYLKAIK